MNAKVKKALRLKKCVAGKTESPESRIGRIIFMLRLIQGFRQIEFCRIFACSQSAFSKTENGVLVPDAIQWMTFCRKTGASPWCFMEEQEIRAIEERFVDWLIKTRKCKPEEAMLIIKENKPKEEISSTTRFKKAA